MPRVFFLSVVSTIAIAVALALTPRLRERRRPWILAGVALFCLAVWLAPVLLGLTVFGTIPLVGRPLKFVTSYWFVVCFLTIVLGLPALLLRRVIAAGYWVRTRAQREEHIDERRRAFLMTLGKGIPATAALSGAVGVGLAELPFKVRRETVPLTGLPAALEGFRIGQISDAHVGAFVTPSDIARAVQALDDEGVDVHAMTGDLSDDITSLDETVRALAANRAPHGMFAIFGNHEHFRGTQHFVDAYRRLGGGDRIRLLVNESAVIRHNGASIRFVGLDYLARRADRAARVNQLAGQALAAVQPGELAVCLAHDPDSFPATARHGARLTLSGHTHGGQVAVIGPFLLSLFIRHVLGWYHDGDNHLYVSPGTGHWLPFRLGIPAEVTVFTLRRA